MPGFGGLFAFETSHYAAQAGLEHVANLLFLLLSAETILYTQLWPHSMEDPFSRTLGGQ